jgi:hypothetical protein
MAASWRRKISCAPHLQELAGLGHVLGGRAPVHETARVALAGAVELPHQRHQRMAGASQPLPHRGQVQEGEVRLADDLAASTSNQDWKRAGSVNSARTPGSSIRRDVGSSSMGDVSSQERAVS